MSTPTSAEYRIKGMDCASCALTVEKGVSRLTGVEDCSINFTTEILRVQGDVPHAEIVSRVEKLGYQVAADDEQPAPGAPASPPASFLQFMATRRDTRLALLGAILVAPGVLFNEMLPMLGWQHPLFDWMSIGALLTAGLPIARSAWRTMTINREININVLMTIASVGAMLIGAYTEAGLVMVLFAIGEALEGYTSDRARNSIRGLMEIVPQTATVLRPCIDCQGHLGQDGYTGGPCPFCGVEEHIVGVDDLKIAETVLVKPGERIPVDGRTLAGSSSVNQSAITGESLPVHITPGSPVFASSINGEGALEIEVTHLPKDNTISRLIRMVEEASEKRAPAQRFVDKFAKYYTPAVMVLAVLVAALPPLLTGAPLLSAANPAEGWLYRALALLVVACPCALVISTPVSLISAISNAARRGVLFKGGAYLEILAKVQAIAFDKTGTLTEGQPSVVRVRSIACTDPETDQCPPCDDLLALASAVEQRSEHPLARAVVNASAARGVHRSYAAAKAVTALAGKGITGKVNGQEVFIGSHQFFDTSIPHVAAHCAEAKAAEANGHTSLLVRTGEQYAGYITVSDAVRERSAAAVSALKDAGIGHLIMLTGDNEATARRIGETVGVTAVRANLLPEHKVRAVEGLLDEYETVAMVGDGINDTPALAAASVGVAMGGSGTAQAMETADIVLMADDLGQLPFAVRLSRTTMRTIWANILLALGIKFAFLVLVMLGMGSMWLAVFADMGTSLIVTLNGMRLLRYGLNH